VVDAPDGLLDEYEMLWGLAKRLGFALPLAGGPCPTDQLPDKAGYLDLMTAGCLVAPSKVRDDSVEGAAVIYSDLHPKVEPPDPSAGGRFNLAAGDMPTALRRSADKATSDEGHSFLLVTRRTRSRFNSTGGHLPALKAKRTTNPAHLHPDDLDRLGISEGDLVRIESAVGTIVSVAEASSAVRPGIVSIAHAYGDVGSGPDSVRAQGVSTNRLVRETHDYDPITGQSLQSAIPVNIARH
jgi:anaerobic selenocysteine-containing dehydrogenase